MPHRDIVVIGASAGGVEALTRLVSHLPANLAAAVFIVIHFPGNSVSVLPHILTRAGKLPAVHPASGDRIHPGKIYIAPPNHHLLVEQGIVRLVQGPKENGHRPAIDALFRSAARHYRHRVIGVVLSGLLDDGTSGLGLIKRSGGIALVQNPAEALFDSMPKSAIAHVEVDQVAPINQLAQQIGQYVQEFLPEEQGAEEQENQEEDIVFQRKQQWEQHHVSPNESSMLTRPGCGGVLWELDNQDVLRFRCHVGHTYSIDSLLSKQSNALEGALWTAIRALEERASLSRRMALQAREQHRLMSEQQFAEQAHETAKKATIIRQIITSGAFEAIATSPDQASNSGNGSDQHAHPRHQ